MNLTVQQLNRALMHARWDGPFDPQKAVDELNSALAEKPAERPAKCPTCDSPAPHLHPAVQHEGEVQPCSDTFHKIVTPQNAERPQLSAEQVRLTEEQVRECMLWRQLPGDDWTNTVVDWPESTRRLNALLTGVEEPPAQPEPRWKNAVCFTCEGESGLPPSRTVDICEKCYGDPATEYELAATPPVIQADVETLARRLWGILRYTHGKQSSIREAAHVLDSVLAAIRREAERAAFEKAAQAVDGWGVFEHEINHAHRLAAAIRALADSPVSGNEKRVFRGKSDLS